MENQQLKNDSERVFALLPADVSDFLDQPWADVEPFFNDLIGRKITPETAPDWLRDWTRLVNLLAERHTRLYIATTVDTSDQEAERRYHAFLDEIFPKASAAEQQLKEALLASGIEPAGFGLPLRKMRVEAELFRQANLPLLTEEQKLGTQYKKVTGGQAVNWEGEEVTVIQLKPVYQDADRQKREQAWRLGAERQLKDREAINDLWQKFLELRLKLAANADQPDYTAYRWQQMLRLDYTPQHCEQFRRAIGEAVVPAAAKVYEKRREQLNLPTLRPWDLDVDPLGRAPLRPFKHMDELIDNTRNIFGRVDEALGVFFQTMKNEQVLDLNNRKNKAPGGYCAEFAVRQLPFIFMNAVGIHDDVQTLLHESGHSFHVFERSHLPYHQQKDINLEFAEVASMSMELLAGPYLGTASGGFYSEQEAARAQIEHLEEIVLFWPYMAVVDGFQHWVYQHPDLAADPGNCDDKWAELWQQYMVGVDWSGLEEEMKTGWHRKLHIHLEPFYYVEYGLAQLGAVQVWANSLKDHAAAVAQYRKALSLGGTVTLPELFAAAGARLAFDRDTLQRAVSLVVDRIEELSEVEA